MRYVPRCVHRLELGAYLIGITTAAERSRIRDHLAECAECRCELNELAPVISLLAAAAPWL
jgi:predicted anti-sigma-YlaC factor YlaD